MQASILIETLKLAFAGLVLGAVASWLTARALQKFLFGVTVSDPVTFGAVFLLLSAFAALAGLFSGTEGVAVESAGCAALRVSGATST